MHEALGLIPSNTLHNNKNENNTPQMAVVALPVMPSLGVEAEESEVQGCLQMCVCVYVYTHTHTYSSKSAWYT